MRLPVFVALLGFSLCQPALPAQFADWVTLRDQQLVRQAQDFSCGAAALATLLTYYHDHPVSEADLLHGVNPHYSPRAGGGGQQDLPVDANAVLREQGVSMRNLAELAQARGFHAVAIAASTAALQRLELPVIAYVEPDGEPHFTVVRGIGRDGSVQVADPSWGNMLVSAQRFANMFTAHEAAMGKLLVVSDGKGDRRARKLFALNRPLPLLSPRPPQGSRPPLGLH